MGFKGKTFWICTILCTFMYYAMVHFWRIGNKVFGGIENFFLRELVIFTAAFLFSAITSLLIFTFSKSVKSQNAIMTEFEKNGYSEKFIELSSAEVNRLGANTVKTRFNNIYVNYVLNLANAYLYHEDIQNAMETINRLSPEELKDNLDTGNLITMIALLNYFDMQINICDEMKDLNRLQRVMADARPYFEKYRGKSPTADTIINESNCFYFRMMGQYDEAMRYADECLKKKDKLNGYVGNLLKATVFADMGRVPEALQCVDDARGFTRNVASIQQAEALRGKIIKEHPGY